MRLLPADSVRVASTLSLLVSAPFSLVRPAKSVSLFVGIFEEPAFGLIDSLLCVGFFHLLPYNCVLSHYSMRSFSPKHFGRQRAPGSHVAAASSQSSGYGPQPLRPRVQRSGLSLQGAECARGLLPFKTSVFVLILHCCCCSRSLLPGSTFLGVGKPGSRSTEQVVPQPSSHWVK